MFVVCLVCSVTITAISYGTSLRLTYITLPLIACPSYRSITDWIVCQKIRFHKCIKNNSPFNIPTNMVYDMSTGEEQVSANSVRRVNANCCTLVLTTLDFDHRSQVQVSVVFSCKTSIRTRWKRFSNAFWE